MRIVSLILTALMVASLTFAAPAAKKKVTPLSEAERRQLAGVIGTLDLVEARLHRDIALGRLDAASNIQRALDILAPLKNIADRGPGPCPPGTCPDDGICKPCFPPFCGLISFNGDLRGIKSNLMAGLATDEPAFRANAKRVLAVTQQLVKLVSGKEPLTASGYCPAMEILMPCEAQHLK